MSLFSGKKASANPAPNLIPSLQDLVNANHFDAEQLTVPCTRNTAPGQVQVRDRTLVPVTDGESVVFWSVPSLTSLFRGDAKPPAEMKQYPEEYVPYFYFIEKHVLLLGQTKGDRTDQEMEETFTALRRRPDGRSLGPTHDYLWQVAALLLGIYLLSEEQYTAIMSRLEQSVRAFALRPVSRFYADYLKRTFQK